jgi:8-oxo-dGTP pyrophosphatase MutT (NUDIX family)
VLNGSEVSYSRSASGYQGAILGDHHLLLIEQTGHAIGHINWFLLGGIEPSETEEHCVQREVREETGLHVRVQSLLGELLECTRSGTASFVKEAMMDRIEQMK